MAQLSKIKVGSTTYNVRDDVHTWGGRNLLQGTTFNRTSDLSFYAANQAAQLSIAEDKVLKVLNGQTSSTPGFYYKTVVLPIGLYTFSCKIKSVTSNGVVLAGGGIWTTGVSQVVAFSGLMNSKLTDTTNWTFNKGVANLTTAGTYRIYFFLNANNMTATDGVYIKEMKLEYGNKSTDWSPAPEDIAHVNGTTLELIS